MIESAIGALKVNDYDGIADVYNETMGEDLAAFIFPKIANAVKRRIRRKSLIRFLDLGCGSGAIISRFGDVFSSDIYGIDRSEKQIQFALRLTKASHQHITLLVGDFLKTEFPTNCNLVTLNLDVLNHVTSVADWSTLLDKIYICLAPGGILMFDLNSKERILRDWDYPEVILKKHLTYIQCGLNPVTFDGMVKRKIFMRVYLEHKRQGTHYDALVEQMAMSNKRLKGLLNKSGFDKIELSTVARSAIRQHIFLKNRIFVTAYK
jgi:SAM-dependent methyltransferase